MRKKIKEYELVRNWTNFHMSRNQAKTFNFILLKMEKNLLDQLTDDEREKLRNL